MKGKVLITGGAGLIGRANAAAFVRADYDVSILDNLKMGKLEYIQPDIAKEVSYVKGDIRDAECLDKVIRGKDLVVHLAAPSSFLMYEENARESTELTVMGFLNVLEAMRKNQVPKVVYASTSAVYEGNLFPYREDMRINPPDLKALSKKWCEEVAAQYSNRYGLTAIGMRPFSVYGIGEDIKGGYANTISLFAWAMIQGERPILWGNGEQTRDYIFADDAARVFVLAAQTDLKTQVFNVGTGIETSFNQVVGVINELLGTDLQPVYVPVPIAIYAERLLADTRHAEQRLGFKPTTTVTEGIRRVVQYAKTLKDEGHDLSHLQRYVESSPLR